MDLKDYIREIQDFPKPGIGFKDITPLLQDSRAFSHVASRFYKRYSEAHVDYVVGIESRGFLFAPVLAHALNCGLVIIRKQGKLPAETVSLTYDLEYGQDTLEIHRDALPWGARTVLMDDLLATGGTAAAAADLLHKVGARISEIAFVVELAFLEGRHKLAPLPVYSQISY